MDSKDRLIIKKISKHINSVISYCQECENLEMFQSDSMRVEACVFNLMQIGEIAKTSLSDEAKTEISTIPWKQIYGMRNKIVHGYDGVDMTIVWETIKYDLPRLNEELMPLGELVDAEK